MEEPFFFENGEQRLFGVVHSPDKSIADKCFLLIHPFGEEKLWSHRVFVNFARGAAKRGYPVLRFDLSGHGDSDDQTENCTLSNWLADIDLARTRMKAMFPDVKTTSFVGLRLGATLAYLSASQSRERTNLILWEPILNGARYMQELLRINLSTQMAVFGGVKQNRESLVENMKLGELTNVDGYLICHKFFEDCTRIDLAQPELPRNVESCLVVQIAPNVKQKSRPDLVHFANSISKGAFIKVEEAPFWREIKPFSSRAANLVTATLEYVETRDGY